MNPSASYQVVMKSWGGEPRWQLLRADGSVEPEAERFLQGVMLRGLSPRTRRTYAYDLLCAFRWMEEARVRPPEVSGEQLLAFIEFQQRPPPASPSTINRRLRLLQRFVEFHTGASPTIPAWGHQRRALRFHRRSRRGSLRVKEPHRVVHPPKDAEVLEFFRHLKTWRDRLIVLLMWAEGLRSAEVLNLTFADIDLPRGSLRILGKGRKERVMPLAEPVVKALLLYTRLERPTTATERLMVVHKGPRRDQPLSAEGLRRIFRYHRGASGILRANPHRCCVIASERTSDPLHRHAPGRVETPLRPCLRTHRSGSVEPAGPRGQDLLGAGDPLEPLGRFPRRTYLRPARQP